MKCPQCHSSNLRKDGHQNGKQRFECKDCGRLLRVLRSSEVIISSQKDLSRNVLEWHGFRAIERVTGIHHTTIMNWVKESAQELPEDEEDHPTVAELDELQTYVGRRTDKVWLWTAINHHALAS
jgi:transposase-like protein